MAANLILSFYDTRVTDFQEVARCRELICFIYQLDGWQAKMYYEVSDFSFLKELSQLETVIITGSKLEDVSVFTNLHKLDTLYLEEFRALKSLCASENFFTEEQMQEYRERYPHIEFDFES